MIFTKKSLCNINSPLNQVNCNKSRIGDFQVVLINQQKEIKKLLMISKLCEIIWSHNCSKHGISEQHVLVCVSKPVYIITDLLDGVDGICDTIGLWPHEVLHLRTQWHRLHLAAQPQIWVKVRHLASIQPIMHELSTGSVVKGTMVTDDSSSDQSVPWWCSDLAFCGSQFTPPECVLHLHVLHYIVGLRYLALNSLMT